MLSDTFSTPQSPKNWHVVGGGWITWGLVKSFEPCPIAGLSDHGKLLDELFFVGNVTKPGDAGSYKFGGKIGHITRGAENNVVPEGHIRRENWWGGKF